MFCLFLLGQCRLRIARGAGLGIIGCVPRGTLRHRHGHKRHIENLGQAHQARWGPPVVCRQTPQDTWDAKALGLFVVAYALSPIDLIPDFIPVLGYVDNVLLLAGLIWLTLQLLPPDVLTDCRGQADAWMQTQGAKPRSMAGAVLVVALWLLVGSGFVGVVAAPGWKANVQ